MRLGILLAGPTLAATEPGSFALDHTADTSRAMGDLQLLVYGARLHPTNTNPRAASREGLSGVWTPYCRLAQTIECAMNPSSGIRGDKLSLALRINPKMSKGGARYRSWSDHFGCKSATAVNATLNLFHKVRNILAVGLCLSISSSFSYSKQEWKCNRPTDYAADHPGRLYYHTL